MGTTKEKIARLEAELASLRKEDDASSEHIASPTTMKRKSPPHTHIASPPKRTRVVDTSSLIVNGKLERLRSGGSASFRELLMQDNQAYFDRTRYISVLEDFDKCILFCRPRRFGKSLTISMLEHFHGLQYAGEHQTCYQDLDVQKDIDGKNQKGKKYEPGQYFVLKFDFSPIQASPDLAEANRNLIVTLNSSFKDFYETYATYLGDDADSLCQNIDSDRPGISLQNCNRLVQRALKEGNEQLAGVQGIYVLVDEYDAFTNSYLQPSNIVEPHKTTLDGTVVEETIKSFWSMVKILRADRIRKVFITGISPLSLSGIGSAFNVSRNLSHHRDLAGLCGLTSSDLKAALKEIGENDKHLSEMTKSFNGYHFCNYETVETMYNTETCLAYLQCVVDGGDPETTNPPNSEVAEQFLEKFGTSASVITDFEKAIKCDEDGNFIPLEYYGWKPEFTLRDLGGIKSQSSWRSLMVYFGALTFRPKDPESHLKIPNKVAARRIASAILERYQLSQSLDVALHKLIQDGDIEPVLSCYRDLMTQRDVTVPDLIKTDEPKHRDSFYFSLLRNHQLLPRVEFNVTKPSRRDGRIDLLFQVPGRLIVTEWKFYRTNYLEVPPAGGYGYLDLAKAAALCNYKLPEILQLRFASRDQLHKGTIGSWVMGIEGPQLRDYIKSDEVRQLAGKLELRAHLVIIVGSRHILLWDMDKEGILATEPRLVEMPSRSNGQDGRGYYS